MIAVLSVIISVVVAGVKTAVVTERAVVQAVAGMIADVITGVLSVAEARGCGVWESVDVFLTVSWLLLVHVSSTVGLACIGLFKECCFTGPVDLVFRLCGLATAWFVMRVPPYEVLLIVCLLAGRAPTGWVQAADGFCLLVLV